MTGAAAMTATEARRTENSRREITVIAKASWELFGKTHETGICHIPIVKKWQL
jgi:hypothetical protein